MGGWVDAFENNKNVLTGALFGGLPLVFFVTEDTLLVFLDK